MRLRRDRSPTATPCHGARGRVPPRVVMVAGTAAAGLFAVLAVATVIRHGAPYPVDRATLRWVLQHRPRAVVDLAIVVTTSGTGLVAYSLAALAGALACRGRWWWGAVAGAVVLACGQLVRVAVAHWIGRSRPPAADWAWHASGPAMPSGHATSSAIVALLLGLAVARGRPGRARTAAELVVGLWALAVGASRVYLGMHWVTDVIAGWLLAIAWLALVVASVRAVGGRATAIRRLRRRGPARRP